MERSRTGAPSLVLAGRLEAFSLADVLQLLASGRRTGVLAVEREEPPERAEIELVEGRVIRAERSGAPDRVGALLLGRGRLRPDQLGAALQRRAAAARPLESVLLEMEAVEPGELAEALVEQIEETVAAVLSWNGGVFRFRGNLAPGPAEPRPLAGVALETQEILLEAARRLDEWGTATLH